MGVLDKFRKRPGDGREDAPPRVVLAAAMPMTGPGVEAIGRSRVRGGEEAWQAEAWYFYDAVGELRSPTNWIANAVSKADVYAAETDPVTGLVTGPTDNARAQQAAALVLGGMARRAQLQYLLAVCWQIPGEAWIIIRPRGMRDGVQLADEWLVLSGSKMKIKGSKWTYTDPITLMLVTLGKQDRLIRVWSPHPNDQGKADSAVRPALPVLREIEKSSMNIASRLDSRLAGNGLLLIPEEMDFPKGDHDTIASAFMDYLYQAMEASLKNPGQASAQVPIIAQAPGEFIGMMEHIDISTDFDAAVVDLRSNDLSRLAATLDMPKSVAEGTQAEANHWSAWQVDESTYKIFIEPLLDRIGDAVTEYWYHPVLKAMGETDPSRYVLAWDTTGLISSPDQSADMKWLHEQGLISDDAMRTELGVTDGDAPDEAELQLRRLERIVVGAPTLAADPQIASLLFGFEIAPAAAGVPGQIEGGQLVEPPPEPAPEPGARGVPATRDDDPPEGLVAAAELLVYDALSRAGGRLLTREYRGQFASTPKHELHTVITTHSKSALLLMADSFQFADNVAQAYGLDAHAFGRALRTYTHDLLVKRTAHDREALKRALR